VAADWHLTPVFTDHKGFSSGKVPGVVARSVLRAEELRYIVQLKRRQE
jgi:hypothetical protein